MTKLRVAYDVLPLAGELTGVGRFCAGLAAALVELEDLELVGYAIARHGRKETATAAHDLGLDVRAWSVPTRVANVVWQRAELPPIEWLVGTVGVVHGTNYVVPPARRAGRVVSVHDLTALRYPEMCVPASLAYPGLVRQAARKGAFVHVPSGFVRDEVVERLGVDAERVRVVPYGVDGPGQITPARAAATVAGPARAGRPPRSAPYVLALGAVEPRKDLPTLVGAFAQLARSNEDLELVVAGPQGWAEPAFAAAVAACGVARRVVRLGYLKEDERLSLLSGAVALAYPSLYEGFGFPPLEAMAAGVPVVATTAGSLPEVLGDAAELVAPGDAAALAGALQRVIEDEALRARLIEAGRARAASFTWASAAVSIAELYRVAAESKRSRS
ncbi:MAG: glycosyltransferase family 1 protein [Acidimicrobiales bacterium]